MVVDRTSPVVASYLIESLTFNAPNTVFQHSTWGQRVRSVLAHAWKDTELPESERAGTKPTT
jgi:hypothetical protein